VNAPGIAQERGLATVVTTDEVSPDHRNIVTLNAALSRGVKITVSGTLMGIRQVQKIVAIDSYDLDLVPSENMIFMRYPDRPGIVGTVGNILGRDSINIGGMQVARNHEGGEALMAITVDSPVIPSVLEELAQGTGANLVRSVTLGA
jgi:D-3-phosphoglycerate dehydrogenase